MPVPSVNATFVGIARLVIKLSPLLFNFALDYAIRRVQVNEDGLKLNGTHQLVGYADDVNILGGSVHTLKENLAAESKCGYNKVHGQVSRAECRTKSKCGD